MEILNTYGKEDLATLYIARYDEQIIEFVESIQPPVTREEKWVIVLSTLYGCPMKCLMCDAGEYYLGKVSKEGMLAQIDYIVSRRFPDRYIPAKKFKIQFARMGEPSLNNDVLDLLKDLPTLFNAPGLIPCISTVAPNACGNFLDKLLEIKNDLYPNGHFQLQFSIHSSDEDLRHKWISSKIWSFTKIAEFGKQWYKPSDRKITLNFAVAEDSVIDPKVIREYFNPDTYLIKLTPINPTNKAIRNDLQTGITRENAQNILLAQEFKDLGYNTIVSIGAWEENQIGTNCGQFATKYQNGTVKLKDNYTCEDYQISSLKF
ncbi:MAG: radical SAM protein [Promethearchaeota archaeon]